MAEEVGVEDLGEPEQAEQAVGPRGIVEPAEGQVRREVHALPAHRRHDLPDRHLPDVAHEVRVVGHDDGRIPQHHLLEADLHQAARLAARDVARAEELDHLDVDRPAQAGDEPLRAAGVVHRRALVGRHRGDPRLERVHLRAPVGRELAALRLVAQHLGELLDLLRRRLQAPVEQDVGDARLLLHAVGEGGERAGGRAHVDDEVGLRLQHDLDVGGAAAAGEAPQLGKLRVLRRHPGLLVRRGTRASSRGACPAAIAKTRAEAGGPAA